LFAAFVKAAYENRLRRQQLRQEVTTEMFHRPEKVKQ
jgi:hypothetical protein